MRSAGPDPSEAYRTERDSHWHPSGALLDREHALRVLREGCDRSGWSIREVLDATVLQERPGRRRTIVYRVLAAREGEAWRSALWFAKQYASNKGARVRDLLESLRGHVAPEPGEAPAYTVPDPLGYAAAERLLITASIEGPTLQERLRRGGPADDLYFDLKRIGRALGYVHEAQPSVPSRSHGLRTHGPLEEGVVLDEACRTVAASCWTPACARRFANAAATVRRALWSGGSSGAQLRWLHRDLHPGQISVGEPIGFLDWDSAAWGEPELDLGNLEAHLILHDLQHARPPRQSESGARRSALRAGYEAVRSIDESRRLPYIASALLRLASLERLANPRLCLVTWQQLSSDLVDEALGHLESAGI